jgi:hypothetical protein
MMVPTHPGRARAPEKKKGSERSETRSRLCFRANEIEHTSRPERRCHMQSLIRWIIRLIIRIAIESWI